MPPKPTTAIPDAAFATVATHAESHELNGSDPVLLPIVSHGRTDLPATYTLTTTLTSIGMSHTITTNGGDLWVNFMCESLIMKDSAASSTWEQCYITVRLQVNGTNYGNAYDIGLSLDTANAEVQILEGRAAGMVSWYIPATDISPGPVLLDILAEKTADADDTSSNISTASFALTLEMNPVRRK